MPDLYILGAGCSVNYSEATHQIRGLRSPLNDDFFRMARLVIENSGMKSDDLFMDEIAVLIKTIAPLYGDKSDIRLFGNRHLRLEDVMTLLDIDFRLFSPLAAQRVGLNESRELRALRDLLARTLEYAMTGPPCRKHRALAERMKRDDVVLSLNYDILIDNALFNLGKTKDSGYRMNFFKVNLDGEWMRPTLDSSAISLFKLHGSLNWIRCRLCGALLLYRQRKQILNGVELFRCPRCSSEETAERMMMPPIQSKDYGDKDIAFLWFQADRAMKEFSRMVCIGYSFSPLDSDMISLMRRLRSRQARIAEVDFVSPDRRAGERLGRLLGMRKMNHFRNLSHYLEST